jgi:hypothetical protein
MKKNGKGLKGERREGVEDTKGIEKRENKREGTVLA